MSAYTEKIEKHTVYTNLQNVEAELAIINEIPNKPPADIEALARISQVIKNFSIALDSCDKNLIAIQWLDESAKALVNIKSYLNTYKSNKDPNYLITHSFGQLDSILQCSTKLNCVQSKATFRSLTKSVDEYNKVISSYIEESHEKVTALTTEIFTLKEQIKNQETVSEAKLLELQNAITSERQRLDGFATSYQNQMSTDQKSFSSMLDSLKESFSSAQEGRRKVFEEEIYQIKDQEQIISQNAVEQADIIKHHHEQLLEEYEEKFKEYENQVIDIVGIINTNVFSHKYKEVADKSHNSARLWHTLTIILMIAVSGFAAYAFVITVTTDTSWVKLIAKIFATTTLATGAAYSARQASKKEKVERYARKIEMELVAIDPFIASLDEERQSKIKEELAKKIFGNPNALEINSNDESYVAMDKLTSIENLVKSLTDIIKVQK